MTSKLKKHEIIDVEYFVPRALILFNLFAAIFYLSWWVNFGNVGNYFLYTLLFIGEIYHVWQAFGYGITLWNTKKPEAVPKLISKPSIDIFITVCGEPISIVENTLISALNIDYPNFKVIILNDGLSRNLPNWRDIEVLAEKYKVQCISRELSLGAKAGNINNGLNSSKADLIVVFDADHVPSRDFLKKTVGYFNDPKVALVQTPQYYANKDDSFLTVSAWEQQELFFGPICRGKNTMNATFWCGTNAVVRRSALMEIGGVPENNIAEDFLASLMLHKRGWKSVYVPEILTKGLAPHDLGNYISQQFRWARGSSEILFKYNPLFDRSLTWGQQLQYLYSASYYLNGFIALIDALVPVVFLFTGIVPVLDNTGSFMLYFFPFIFSTIALLMISTKNTITFRAIQLSMSSSFVFINAVLTSLFGLKSTFKITSKEQSVGNFIKLATPNIVYVLLGFSAIVYALFKYGVTPAVLTNASWVIFNAVMFSSFIFSALNWKHEFVLLKRKLHMYFAQVFQKISFLQSKS